MTVQLIQRFNGELMGVHPHRVTTLNGLRRVVRRHYSGQGWHVTVQLTAKQLDALGGYVSRYGQPMLDGFQLEQLLD